MNGYRQYSYISGTFFIFYIMQDSMTSIPNEELYFFIVYGSIMDDNIDKFVSELENRGFVDVDVFGEKCKPNEYGSFKTELEYLAYLDTQK